jgi:hypothetical protein
MPPGYPSDGEAAAAPQPSRAGVGRACSGSPRPLAGLRAGPAAHRTAHLLGAPWGQRPGLINLAVMPLTPFPVPVLPGEKAPPPRKQPTGFFRESRFFGTTPGGKGTQTRERCSSTWNRPPVVHDFCPPLFLARWGSASQRAHPIRSTLFRLLRKKSNRSRIISNKRRARWRIGDYFSCVRVLGGPMRLAILSVSGSAIAPIARRAW